MAEKRLRFANSSTSSTQPTQEKRLRFENVQETAAKEKAAQDLWNYATTPKVNIFQNRRNQFPEFNPVAIGENAPVAEGVRTVTQEQYNLIKNARNEIKADYAKKNEKPLTYEEVQAKKNEYAPGTPEYEMWDNYADYDNYEDFEKALNDARENAEGFKQQDWYIAAKNAYENWDIPTVGTLNKTKTQQTGVTSYYTQEDVDKAVKERDEYMKKILGGKTWDEINNNPELNEKKSKYNNLKSQKEIWDRTHSSKKYKHYVNDPDFEKKSAYVEKYAISEYGGIKGVKFEDDAYAYINNPTVTYSTATRRNQTGKVRDIMSGTLADSSTKRNAEKFKEKGYDHLLPEEIGIYNMLYAEDQKNGTNKAQEFLDDLETELTTRKYQKGIERIEKAADSNVFAAIGLSVLSVPANVVGGIKSFSQTVKELFSGQPLNPHHGGRDYNNMASSIRSSVSENIAEATEGFELFGTNIPSFLYNTAMSVGDSVLGAVMLNKLYSVVAGSTAFTETARELYEEGEPQHVIFATAFVSGVAETIFEYMSIGAFLKITKVPGVKSAIKNVIKMAFVEGSEEISTEGANILGDTFIRGDTSKLSKMYEEFKTQGLDDSEIKIQMAKQIGLQLGWAFVGGFLSGGAMGGGASVSSLISTKQYAKIGKEVQTNLSSMPPKLQMIL